MTAKLDFATIEAVYELGGYEIDAVLSDSTAYLALLGLTLLQPKWLWQNYDEFDDVETVIDEAISQIMNGGSVVTDYQQIGEEVVTSDEVSVTCDIDAGGGWTSFDVIMTGLRSNRAAQVSDNGMIWVNGNTVATNYNSINFYLTGSAHTHGNIIGTKAGFWIPYGIAAVSADSGCWGSLRMTIFDPLHDDRKKHVQWSSSLAGQTSGEIRECLGSGLYEVSEIIESISINPEYGATFLIDPGAAGEPRELAIRVYGRK